MARLQGLLWKNPWDVPRGATGDGAGLPKAHVLTLLLGALVAIFIHVSIFFHIFGRVIPTDIYFFSAGWRKPPTSLCCPKIGDPSRYCRSNLVIFPWGQAGDELDVAVYPTTPSGSDRATLKHSDDTDFQPLVMFYLTSAPSGIGNWLEMLECLELDLSTQKDIFWMRNNLFLGDFMGIK